MTETETASTEKRKKTTPPRTPQETGHREEGGRGGEVTTQRWEASSPRDQRSHRQDPGNVSGLHARFPVTAGCAGLRRNPGHHAPQGWDHPPPQASTTSGQKVAPRSATREAVSKKARLRCSTSWKTSAAEGEADDKWEGRSSEDTEKSQASAKPEAPQGTQTSAGRRQAAGGEGEERDDHRRVLPPGRAVLAGGGGPASQLLGRQTCVLQRPSRLHP